MHHKHVKSVATIVAIAVMVGLPILVFSTQQQTDNQQHASFQNLNTADLISSTNNPDGTMGPPDASRNYANAIDPSQTGTLTMLITDPQQSSPAANFHELLYKDFPSSGTNKQLPKVSSVPLHNAMQVTATPVISQQPEAVQGSPQKVSALQITIAKVEVHFAQQANIWETLALDGPKTIDLVQLAKGGLASLGLTKLAAEEYSEIRMYITNATATLPDGTHIQIPIQGKFVIVRIVKPFTIIAGANTNITIDFDAENSVIKASDQYLLKPVIANFLESRK